MRLLTRVSPEIREGMHSLDPTRRYLAGSADELQRPATPRGAGLRGSVSGGSWARWTLPIVTAVVATAVAGLSVAIVRQIDHAHRSHTAASAPRRPTPAGFPVDRTPRPVVLLDSNIVDPGFRTVDDKIAYGNGQLRLATPEPTSPTTIDGYPILPATRAVALLTTPRHNADAARILTITHVRLGTHVFENRRRNTEPARMGHPDQRRRQQRLRACHRSLRSIPRNRRPRPNPRRPRHAQCRRPAFDRALRWPPRRRGLHGRFHEHADHGRDRFWRRHHRHSALVRTADSATRRRLQFRRLPPGQPEREDADHDDHPCRATRKPTRHGREG